MFYIVLLNGLPLLMKFLAELTYKLDHMNSSGRLCSILLDSESIILIICLFRGSSSCYRCNVPLSRNLVMGVISGLDSDILNYEWLTC